MCAQKQQDPLTSWQDCSALCQGHQQCPGSGVPLPVKVSKEREEEEEEEENEEEKEEENEESTNTRSALKGFWKGCLEFQPRQLLRGYVINVSNKAAPHHSFLVCKLWGQISPPS